MSERMERALWIAFPMIIIGIVIGAIVLRVRLAPTSIPSTIGKAVLTLPDTEVYEFDTPGQMHCVLAVDKAARWSRTPALSCIKISSLKSVDPRRWQKSLPTPDQDT